MKFTNEIIFGACMKYYLPILKFVSVKDWSTQIFFFISPQLIDTLTFYEFW